MTLLSSFGRRFGAPVVAAMSVAFVSASESPAATRIERVVSPGGIEAWLVREPAVPLIAFEFAFKGGATQDVAGKEGTANLVSGLLDEGAGDLLSLIHI